MHGRKWLFGQVARLQSTRPNKLTDQLLPAAYLSNKAALNSHRPGSTIPAGGEPIPLPLSVSAYLVWGANTDVGKTLVSSGLVAAALQAGDRVGYFKPVQTGFPTDSDARTVAAVAGVQSTYGHHAAQIASSSGSGLEPVASPLLTARTLFAWQSPVSPHLAVQNEGRPASDEDIRASVLQELNSFASSWDTARGLAIVETAGGPASPMPSGRLQCESWRLARLPGLLVGDGRLGGISTTVSAYETLQMRGCPPVAIALMQKDAYAGNAAALRNLLGQHVPVVELPYCPLPAMTSAARSATGQGGVDSELSAWLRRSREQLTELLERLHAAHELRLQRLRGLAEGTLQHIWWPFTQHQGMSSQDVTVIESRVGEAFMVLQQQQQQQHAGLEHQGKTAQPAPHLAPKHDACSSWWTQGVSEEHQPRLVKALAEAAGRYGHVMHPETAHEPALGLAKHLLSLVGAGWADRVFYSDDGSTAVEVGLKMAMRKFRADNGDVAGAELQVVGLQNGYHGDTLGAMDAVAPSDFNGPQHMPWYKGRGLFLDPPHVGLKDGEWQVMLPAEMAVGASTVIRPGWTSRKQVFDKSRDDGQLVQHYMQWIEAHMQRHQEAGRAAGAPVRLAVCLLEPVLQGAGGMYMVDPAFQRALVRTCRSQGMTVLLDEVFSGLWRLGAPSAASLLHVQPDVAAYAKLLTGGMLPLSATLASSAVFDAFRGSSKLEALLHGHSYAGNAIGCALAQEALKVFSSPQLNSNLSEEPGAESSLVDLWDASLVNRLSHSPRVQRVVALGTVLAAELVARDGGGYASGEAKAVVMQLRTQGVFARPLGTVVYLMVTPTTAAATCTGMLQKLVSVVESQAAAAQAVSLRVQLQQSANNSPTAIRQS